MSRSFARKNVESAGTRLDSNRMAPKASRPTASSFPASRGPSSSTPLKYLSTRSETPNTAVQNPTARSTSSTVRAPTSERLRRSRARKLRHFGWRMSCTPAEGCPVSTIEKFTQFVLREPAGELQEELFQRRVAHRGLGAQLVHGPRGDDPATVHDGDAIAHGFGDLEGVRAHQHGAPPVRKLPEQVLEQPRGAPC